MQSTTKTTIHHHAKDLKDQQYKTYSITIGGVAKVCGGLDRTDGLDGPLATC
jgi:hypothetical protein